MALAWVLREPNVASAIIGASRPEQVHANAEASGVELSQDVLDAIDEALDGVVVTRARSSPPSPRRASSTAEDPARVGLRRRQRVDRDRGEMSSGGGDHEDVEDLVVAEHRGVRIRPLAGVDRPRPRCRGSRRPRSGSPAPSPALMMIAGNPRARSSRPPDRRSPVTHFGASTQTISTTIPAAAPAQTAIRSAFAERAAEHQDRERRHGPGDQQEDHRVVEPPHPAADLGPAPIDPVVQGAHPKRRRKRPGVDRGHRGRAPGRSAPSATRAPPATSETKKAHSCETPRRRGLERAIRSSAAALASATRSVAAASRRRPARTRPPWRPHPLRWRPTARRRPVPSRAPFWSSRGEPSESAPLRDVTLAAVMLTT